VIREDPHGPLPGSLQGKRTEACNLYKTTMLLIHGPYETFTQSHELNKFLKGLRARFYSPHWTFGGDITIFEYVRRTSGKQFSRPLMVSSN
jgi:hypothetical protein